MDIEEIICNSLGIDLPIDKIYDECMINIGLSAEEVLLVIIKISQVKNVDLSNFLTKINMCSIKELENIVKEGINA